MRTERLLLLDDFDEEEERMTDGGVREKNGLTDRQTDGRTDGQTDGARERQRECFGLEV